MFWEKTTFQTLLGSQKTSMLVSFCGARALLYSFWVVPGTLSRPSWSSLWAPLVAPGPLWVPFETHYGASERTSRNVGKPSKVWVLAQLGATILLWGCLWRPLGLLSGSLERF